MVASIFVFQLASPAGSFPHHTSKCPGDRVVESRETWRDNDASTARFGSS